MKVRALEWTKVKYEEYLATGYSKKAAIRKVREYAEKLGLKLIEIE